MTDTFPVSETNPAIAVILIDDDIIFRTGLQVWLSQQQNITVVCESDRERSATGLIESTLSNLSKTNQDEILVGVIGLEMNATPTNQLGGLQLCQNLHNRFPTIPFLMVGRTVNTSLLAQVKQSGAKGYGLKSENPNDFLERLLHIAAGNSSWRVASLVPSLSGQDVTQVQSKGSTVTPLAIFKRNLRRSGVRQIESTLAELLHQLETIDLALIDRWVMEGRCRELRVARWMVNRILITDLIDDSRDIDFSIPSTEHISQSAQLRLSKEAETVQPSSLQIPERESTAGALVSAGLEATLFEGAMLKLQSSLRNLGEIPLEIDILQESKKRELLYLVIRKLRELLDVLRQSQVTPRQLKERRSLILRDLWHTVADDYFGRYYAVQVEALEIEVVKVLSEDANLAQIEILDRIPYTTELFSHLLFQDPLMVNGTPHAAGTSEAMMRSEVLLDNCIVQTANSIIQPLLNRLGDVEFIKQGFYDRSLMTSRDIAKFRNNLSWRYRFERVIGDPVDIFESRYRLFVLQGNGIKPLLIYAPRRNELEALQGFSFLVTLALEFRDAVAPRVRAVISFVGSGLIYVLTEVIGRGIGLIVRGVIKGIGNAWQDARFSRDAGQKRF